MPFFGSGGNTFGYQGQFNSYQAPFNLTNSIGGGKIVVWFDPTLYCGSGNWFDRSRNNVLISEIENGIGIKTDANRGVLTASSNNYRFPPGPGTTGIPYMSSFTISAWVKRLGTMSTNSAIVTQSWATSGGRNLQMYATNSGQLSAGFFSTNTCITGANASLLCNAWQNIMLGYNGNQMRLYLNGVQIGESTISVGPQNTNRYYRIGRSWEIAEYFNGEIGDIIFYNSAFSSAAALELYQKMSGKYSLSPPLNSGSVQWATYISLANSGYFPYINTDFNGNIYISGQYDIDSIIINNYSNISNGNIIVAPFGSLANSGNNDIFLAKYNSSGVAQWATSISGINNIIDNENIITTDVNGNTYIAGCNSDSLTFNSYSNINNNAVTLSTFGTLSSVENKYIFLTKYNSSGVAQWATSITCASNINPYSITTDRNGNAYIAGYYTASSIMINNYSNNSNNVILVSTFGTLSNVGASDIFLAKYNSSGVAQWATSIGGTSIDDRPSIATDPDGNIFISGQYTSAPLSINNYSNVNNGIIHVSTFATISSIGGADIFLTKYNSSGVAQWATSIGGKEIDQNSFITTDNNGNVYISVFSISSITINNYSNVDGGILYTSTFGTLITNQNITSLTKYSPTGIAQWTTCINNLSGFSRLSSDQYGNIYITGDNSFNPSITFKSYSNISSGIILVSTFGSLSNPNSDKSAIFLAKYNSSGIIQWVTEIDAYDTFITTPSISFGLDNSMYIGGAFYNSIKFNYFSNVSQENINVSEFGTLSNNNINNIFLAKYTQ